jgi:hypothetical protein
MIVHQIEVGASSDGSPAGLTAQQHARSTPNRHAPFQMQALKSAGVTEVILAINYRPEVRLDLEWIVGVSGCAPAHVA